MCSVWSPRQDTHSLFEWFLGGQFTSEASDLQTRVTPSALDYYFKDYFKPWAVWFVTFVAKQCWPKLCLLARAGTFAWQHYLIVYSGDTGNSFQLQTKTAGLFLLHFHSTFPKRTADLRRYKDNKLYGVWFWRNCWLLKVSQDENLPVPCFGFMGENPRWDWIMLKKKNKNRTSAVIMKVSCPQNSFQITWTNWGQQQQMTSYSHWVDPSPRISRLLPPFLCAPTSLA